MRLLLSLGVLLLSLSLHAQYAEDPISWSHKVLRDGANVMIKTIADIKDGWCLYSQHTPQGGPIPTRFDYDPSLAVLGKTEELSKAIKKSDDLFGVEVIKYKNQAVFRQKIDGTHPLPASSVVNVTYMSCNGHACLPPKTIQLNVNF